MSGELNPDGRSDEIGRLYDEIGKLREYRASVIQHLEGTGQLERLQRFLDETQAVINAFADRIEFLIEQGEAWFDEPHIPGTATELRENLWQKLAAEAEAIETWQRDHKSRSMANVQKELEALHYQVMQDLQSLKGISESDREQSI